MYQNAELWIAQADTEAKEHISIIPAMANRHGLIAGATGTGKTVTLKVIAETFADAGVPVFMADMKGDISGTSQPGKDSPKMQELIQQYGFENFTYKGYSTNFWDIFNEKGIPLRTTISEMGPTLLSQLLELNSTQEDILTIIFKIADDNKWLLLDMKDLHELIQYVSKNNKELSASYGAMSTQSLGAISRSLIALDNQGAGYFFGEPALDIKDWMRCDSGGRGFINIRMAAASDQERQNIIQSSQLFSKYSTAIDRESAYEILQSRFAHEAALEEARAADLAEAAEHKKTEAAAHKKSSGRKKQSALEKGMHSAVTTLSREVTRTLFRGILNTLKKR